MDKRPRRVAKTTTRPTKKQIKKAKQAEAGGPFSERAKAFFKEREAFSAQKKTAARELKEARKELKKRAAGGARHSASRKRGAGLRRVFSLRNIKFGIAALGVVAIATIVFLHFNAKNERISDDGYTHAERFSDYLVVDGIDVSYAQGEVIDWEKVKNSGVDFVFIRAGYRSAAEGVLEQDDQFISNIEGASEAGLMIGAYIYSQAVTADEAKAEAEFLIRLVEPYKITMPLVMDYELYPDGRLERAHATGLLTQKFMNSIAREFCKTVEAAGYESMVYANYDFLTNYLDGSKLDDSTNIWLAHYADATSYPGEYIVWQCSDSGKVPGIEGAVDKDFWYILTDADASKDHSAGGNNDSSDDSGRIDITECLIELKDHSSTYIGYRIEPGVIVSRDGTRLKEDKDYTVSYVKNTDAGTGYAIVRGIGEYRGASIQSFMIKKLF